MSFVEVITSVIPKSALGVALVYGGVTYLYTAPLIQDRVAERHLERCIAGHEAKAQDARRRINVPNPADVLEQMMPRGAPHSQVLDLFGMRQMIEAAGKLKQQQEEERRRAEIESHPSPAAVCNCMADKAKSQTKVAFALWVGGLKFFPVREAENFDGVMQSVATQGLCTGGRTLS